MKKIVIVGGGTAGWSAAALLSCSGKFDITVIDPDTIPTIGVGESTLPHINMFHQHVGFDSLNDMSWIKEVDGTIKFSIEFADFDMKGGYWVHPFVTSEHIDGASIINALPNFTGSQPEFALNNTHLGRYRKKGYMNVDEWLKLRSSRNSAGYHIDASKYSALLKRETLKRKHTTSCNSEVSNIELDNDMSISQLNMSDGSVIKADLYIDCTGQKSLLIDAVGSKFKNVKDRLLVDTALAVQLPYVNKKEQIRNTTYCHALSSGWVFNVPLETRIGTGYVFALDHQSEEEAIEEFKQHLHDMYGYDKADIMPRKIPFRTGYRDEPWTKNVVSIGMSAFFIEPIESTAIAGFHGSISMLESLLTSLHLTDDVRRRIYNKSQNSTTESILDYAELHYSLTSRDDSTFWRYYKDKKITGISAKLAQQFTKTTRFIKDIRTIVEEAHGFIPVFPAVSYIFLFTGYNLRFNSGLLPDKVE